jgi:hypothetical protein
MEKKKFDFESLAQNADDTNNQSLKPLRSLACS